MGSQYPTRGIVNISAGGKTPAASYGWFLPDSLTINLHDNDDLPTEVEGDTPALDQLVSLVGCGIGNEGDGNRVQRFSIPGAGCMGYNDYANPHPTVAVDARIQDTNGSATLATVEAVLDFGGLEETVYYDGSGISSTDDYRLAVQVDASSLGTGRHDWTMTVTQKYSDSSERVERYSGEKSVIDAGNSEFGRRWGIKEYQVLMPDSDGVLWMYAGNLRRFDDDGQGGYEDITDPTGHWQLTGDWTSGFALTHGGDGTQETFNTQGLRTKSTDRNGNETLYSYQNGKLSSITYPGSRVTSFSYDANGKLDYVDDFAGRRTDFSIDANGQLQSFTLPDPDGAGSASPPTYDFGYSTTTGKMSWFNDPESVRTTYVHDAAGTLDRVEHSDNSTSEWTTELSAVLARGLKYVSDGTGTSSNKAPLTDYKVSDLPATRTHSANPTLDTEITVDRFGQPMTIVDALGNETIIERDEFGNAVQITAPDPDGTGPQTSAITQFTYDSQGRILTTTYPDGSIETLTYLSGSIFSQPTSYTLTPPTGSNEPTIQTIYTVDSSTGNVTRERQVNGLNDATDPSDTDADIVIDYSYTDGTETGNPPKGLLETVTFTSHPDQPVTSYIYTAYGELDKITYPDPDGSGWLPSPVTDYVWNSSTGLLDQLIETNTSSTFSYVTDYDYDDSGQVTTVTSPDPDGSYALPRPVVGYTYNADGTVDTVTETTDAAGADEFITDYDYVDGMLQKITYPDPDDSGPLYSPVTEYVYSNGLMTGTYEKSSNPAGESHFTQYYYDALNRLRKITSPDPDGSGPLPKPVVRYYFDNAGRMNKSLDQTTDTSDPNLYTHYEYDTMDRLTAILLPDPNTVGGSNRPTHQSTYYATGQLRTSTDPLGAITTYDRNELDQLIKITLPDPDGTGALESPVTEYVFDSGGRLENEIQTHSGTMAQQAVTAYAYDALDRMLTRTLPDPDDHTSSGGTNGPLASPVYSYVYNSIGDLTDVTDPRDTVTRYAFNALRRPTKEIRDLGGIASTSRFYYDTMGNLSRTLDPEGRNVTFEYDNLHRQTNRIVDPVTWDYHTTTYTLNSVGLALTTTAAYDAFGNLTSSADPKSHTTTYDYDALNRITDSTLHDGANTGYAYDSRGNLESLTDPVGNVTSFDHDYLRRLTSETIVVDGVNLVESYLYDLADNQIRTTDRMGRITQHDRDALGRVFQERWKDNGSTVRRITFDYDDFGRLDAVSETGINDVPVAAAYDYSYDVLGRVTQTVNDLVGLTPDVTLTQAFDPNGNRTQLAAAIDATDDFVNDSIYDRLDRPTKIVQQSQTGGNAVADKLLRFYYNAAGQFTIVKRFASTDESVYVGRTKYEAYDKAGRLSDFKHDGANLAAIDFDVRYDDHQLDYVTYAGLTLDYGYDTVDQLTDTDYTGQNTPTDETHAYDAAGNRTNTGYATGDHNRLSTDGTYTYAYDAEGNRIYRFVDNDGDGQPSRYDSDVTQYVWDHRNRLTLVQSRTSCYYADGTVTNNIYYDYDAFNRLVRRLEDPDGDGPSSYHPTFYLHDGTNPILEFDGPEATDLSHRYLWGPAVDQILADETVDDGGTEDILWPFADFQGSVRHLATYDPQTITTTIVNHKFYDTFGNLTSETNPTIDHLFAYTGRPFDTTTGLQNNLNRWYDPKLGRWLSEDPISFAAGDPNLYRYVDNQPTMSVDPWGLASPREEMCKVTPDMPKDWKVHHTHQQFEIIAERFSKEMGIDVHDTQYLRAMHPDVHDEVGKLQRKFWQQKAYDIIEQSNPKDKISYRAALDKAKRTVPLEDVIEFEKQIEETYGKYWVKSGASKSEVNKVIGCVDTDLLGDSMKKMNTMRRTSKVLKKAGITLGVLGGMFELYDKVGLANNIANPPLRVQKAQDAALEQYTMAYYEAWRFGKISRSRWSLLNRDIINYANAIDLDSAVIHQIERIMHTAEISNPGIR